MSTIIVSDKQQQPYTNYIAETLESIRNYNVTGIAVVVLTDDKKEPVLTGYWNMNLNDKAKAKQEIEYDVIDGLIVANLDRYKELIEE